MKFFIIILILTIITVNFLYFSSVFSASQPPVLMFSDLESGPKTGWEGSSTKGAVVTVWGKNFDLSRGSNYITVNGVQLSSDSDYVEWGVIANNARGLERITFWLNNNAQDGTGTISVTVAGITSNTLPFTVRSGNIYFVSASGGSDSYNGRYATFQGGTNGPWLNPYMADPSRGNVIAGDTIYIRSGIYNTAEAQGRLLYYDASDGSHGEIGRPVAMVGYPTEWPQFGDDTLTMGLRIDYGSLGTDVRSHDLEFHKIFWRSGIEAMELWGDRFRIVGNRFEDSRLYGQVGVIVVLPSTDSKFLGNVFRNNGYNYLKHDFYFNAKPQGALEDGSPAGDIDNVELAWNEFANTWGGGGMTPSVEVKACESCGMTNKIRNVYIHDNYWHDGDGDAIRISYQFELIYVYNNIMQNMGMGGCTAGIVVAQSNSTNSARDAYIYNNTFYGADSSACQEGTIRIQNSALPASIYVRNNIIRAVKDISRYFTNAAQGVFYIDHNCYYGAGIGPGTGFSDAYAVNRDPLFVSPTDYHLSANSPCVDAGTSDVSLTVLKDYNNNPRPMDGDDNGLAEYDIGAYEYLAAGSPLPPDTTPPSAPIGLVVQ